MEIIVGKTAGFCYGVKRAVDNTINETKENDIVYCLGELVHNEQVVDELEKKGVRFIDDIKELPDSNKKIIIRAHGVSNEVYEYAKSNGIKLIDLTCPNVLKVHEIAKDYAAKGYYIFLAGKKEHPENIGTVSYCKNYSVIEQPENTEKALEEFEKSGIKKLLLISQTTYNIEKFYLIREKISYNLKKDVIFEIENTICSATEIRQKETEKLSKEVDCMIIVGGNNSSNTRKLYDIASKNCKNSFLVQDHIEKSDVAGFNRIGIMAGASTPMESVNKIIDIIKGE